MLSYGYFCCTTVRIASTTPCTWYGSKSPFVLIGVVAEIVITESAQTNNCEPTIIQLFTPMFTSRVRCEPEFVYTSISPPTSSESKGQLSYTIPETPDMLLDRNRSWQAIFRCVASKPGRQVRIFAVWGFEVFDSLQPNDSEWPLFVVR